uniref:Carboxylesterase type B domain-containing protein n=1 Tax=Timema genevievae TaxID=629358 RepID=A0A7R9JYL6_TIMGE|nr:unnamed protein product [Timema genevievae]
MKLLVAVAVALFVCVTATTKGGRQVINPVVTTAAGKLRGSVLESRLGKTIYSFRGVRFAQPPVGNLRFKPPAPLQSWEGILNATKDGFDCPQQEGEEYPLPSSEDCLFLNVYTTKLPTTQSHPNRSVVVFFHFGGWLGASGHSSIFGPQYLLDQDVVLVTSNYRLGALGFLSTGDEVLPGNYALKDQVAVLKWVQQNIAAFGGDPTSVTAAGYSAGAHSVILHMLSPMSQGLFHRAISMSGSVTSNWAIQRDPLTLAKRQAALFNCSTDNSSSIYECLMQIDPMRLATSYRGLLEWGWDPLVQYAPVVEPASSGEERFLTADPTTLLQAGQYSQMPLFMGMTKDEFSWRSTQVLANESWYEDMNNDYERIYPIAFMYERNTPRSRYITNELRKFYLNNEPIVNTTYNGLGLIYADALVCFGSDRESKLISSTNREPVYYYKFSYQGRYSFVYNPGTMTPYGVAHHDDLIYVFNISILFPSFQPGDQEIKTVERMTKLWANFIQTG